VTAGVDESAVARWSDRRTIAGGCVVVGIIWLLMLAFVIGMVRQHDPAQATGGVVVLIVDTAVLSWLFRWRRRLVTVLTTAAIYLPARRGPARRILLETVEGVAVARTSRGWAIWLWPAGEPAIRLLTPQRVFTFKAQSRSRPTAEYWAQVASSPAGRAASAIYAQASTRQGGSAGPLGPAPPTAELLRRGPAPLTQDRVRYWSPTDEHAPAT
jgi:hypothetical protein